MEDLAEALNALNYLDMQELAARLYNYYLPDDIGEEEIAAALAAWARDQLDKPKD